MARLAIPLGVISAFAISAFAISALAIVACATATAGPPIGSGGSGTGGSGGGIGVGGAAVSSASSGGDPFADAGPGVDAGMCSAFVETYAPACLACLAEQCCAPALKCAAVSDCFGYANCLANCPTGTIDAGNTCPPGCEATYPSYEPAYDPFAACMSASCAKVCG